jgi:ssRNA-specific RNase YbeY (16S rRNA maturation enzyme)
MVTTRPIIPMKKQKTEIQHKIGLIFYIVFIIGVFSFIGYKHIERTNEQKQIEKEVEEMFNYPNLKTEYN